MLCQPAVVRPCWVKLHFSFSWRQRSSSSLVSSTVQVARFGGICWNVEGLMLFVAGHTNGTEKPKGLKRNNKNTMQWSQLCTCLDFMLQALGTQVVPGGFRRGAGSCWRRCQYIYFERTHLHDKHVPMSELNAYQSTPMQMYNFRIGTVCILY